ncbi:putative deoxynucleoside kinase [Acaryochloris phage A-HIS2]|nr:putative deoxynucleoside kinase [Acaryochloris phage A-HIS2]
MSKAKEHSIAIIGPVGSGKSTLTLALAEREKMNILSEPWEKNPYIPNLPENVFSCQWLMYDLMMESHRKLRYNRRSILDRTFYEVFHIFTRQFKGYLTDQEFEALRLRYDQLVPSVRVPDVTVYLKCHPQVAYERTLQRGRDFEVQKYNLGYFQDQVFLYGGLAAYLEGLTTHLITVDANALQGQVLTETLRKLRAYER